MSVPKVVKRSTSEGSSEKLPPRSSQVRNPRHRPSLMSGMITNDPSPKLRERSSGSVSSCGFATNTARLLASARLNASKRESGSTFGSARVSDDVRP
jgi:hypothetical protein